MQSDIEINNYLTAQGWKVIRFWSEEVEKNLDLCVAKIEKEIGLRGNITCQ